MRRVIAPSGAALQSSPTCAPANSPINERGIINNPDLVIAADESLMALPAAGVLQGLGVNTVVLIYANTDAAAWKSVLP